MRRFYFYYYVGKNEYLVAVILSTLIRLFPLKIRSRHWRNIYVYWLLINNIQNVLLVFLFDISALTLSLSQSTWQRLATLVVSVIQPMWNRFVETMALPTSALVMQAVPHSHLDQIIPTAPVSIHIISYVYYPHSRITYIYSVPEVRVPLDSQLSVKAWLVLHFASWLPV